MIAAARMIWSRYFSWFTTSGSLDARTIHVIARDEQGQPAAAVGPLLDHIGKERVGVRLGARDRAVGSDHGGADDRGPD